MLNILAKSIVFSVGSQLARETYKPVSKFCCDSYKELSTFLGFSGSTSTNTKGKKITRKKRCKASLSQEDIKLIKFMWFANDGLPKKERATQLEMAITLNRELGLDYSRSGYCHIVHDRVEKNRVSPKVTI